MAFSNTNWQELIGDGYTVVSRGVDARLLRRAQVTAAQINAVHPEGGWERSRNESWREIRDCRHPDFVALVEGALDPLAAEILETVHAPERIQLASTMPGFATKGIVGRHFHIDGGQAPSLAAFNALFGVALTDVESDTVGGFHVLPGSHHRFATLFAGQPAGEVNWGEVKIAGQKALLDEARMVVPRLAAGDVIVAHSFLAHGTSMNTCGVRRDMIFQRRAALQLCDPPMRDAARDAFMRDPWLFFRRRA
ncbi:MAG: phytanoyl-CoA dioxygenase family protein [Enhydrobacter sp.]|nr:MAG: phytanoyl-CoA dioxygenase family protein [Enhydrobacter sp.]